MKKIFKHIIYFLMLAFLPVDNLFGGELVIYSPFGTQLSYKNQPKSTSLQSWELEESYQNMIYTGGIYLSEDGGYKWNEINNFLGCHEVNAITTSQDYIFLATNEGLYISPNPYIDSVGWQITRGLDNAVVHSVFSDNDNLILAGITHKSGSPKLMKSVNNGLDWTTVMEGITFNCFFQSPVSNKIFGGTDAGLYYSNDDGATWQRIEVDNNDIKINYITSFRIDDKITFFVCTDNGLFSSDDKAESWEKIKVGPNDGAIINCIEYCDDKIIIGTDSDGIWFSPDNKKQWFPMNEGLPSGNHPPKKFSQVSSLHCNDNNILYAGFSDAKCYTCNLNKKPINWSIISGKMDIEESCRMFYSDGQKVYAVFHGCELYPGSRIIESDESHIFTPNYDINRQDMDKYNCHGFAWHLAEGGKYPLLFDHSPLNEDGSETVYVSEGSYRLIDPSDSLDMLNWQKVTYGTAHSAIRYPGGGIGRAVSKWCPSGPLMEHNVCESPFSCYNSMIQYWTNILNVTSSLLDSAEYLTGTDIKDIKIGKTIITEEADVSGKYTIEIDTGNKAEFRIAPMKDAAIVLKPGFLG